MPLVIMTGRVGPSSVLVLGVLLAGMQAIAVCGVEQSPNGKVAARVGGTGVVGRGERAPMRQRFALGSGGTYGLAFSRDSKLLASAGADAVVRVWDVSVTPPKSRGVLK